MTTFTQQEIMQPPTRQIATIILPNQFHGTSLVLHILASKNVMGSLKAHTLVINTPSCLEIEFFVPFTYSIWAPKKIILFVPYRF